MARATFEEWNQHLNWKGNTGARNDRDAYENYAREYDRLAAAGSVGALRGLNDAHGFTAGVAKGDAPSGLHAGGGGGGGGDNAALQQFQSMFAEMMARYDTLLESFLSQNAESASQPDGGFGYEDTILTRNVLPDEDKTRLAPSYAPQLRVVDPVTGATYPTPQAAVAAGVYDWEYSRVA